MGGGGAERQLTYLARGLAAGKWEVHVALLAGGPYLTTLERSGAVIHVMPGANNYDPRLLMRIGRVVDAVAPAVVQTWMPMMDIAGGFVCSIKGLPWILSERVSNQGYLSPAKRLLRNASARRATAIVANSRAGERYWASRIASASRLFVIENALPLEEMDAVPTADLTRFSGMEGRPVIMAAGRYEPQKNYLVLVQALQIVAQGRDIKALFCGEGASEPAIRSAIDHARLSDQVLLAGFQQDVWGLMKAADVYVSISHFEGRANTVMEAAACGLPLVLSDIPEHREMFGDDAAWFVDRHDPALVARAIGEVLADPAAAQLRADRATQTARQWTVEAMAAHYDAVYSQIALKS